jgi:hypothetical protein
MATTRRRTAGAAEEVVDERREDWVVPNMVRWGKNPTDFGLVVRVVEITPKLAAEWLQYNTRNRKIKPEKVRQFVDDMQAGKWTLNGETMLFSWMPVVDAWQLDDGQNRLRAIMESGVTIHQLVVFGSPFDETIRTTGSGATRTAAEMLQIYGEDDTSILSGAVTRQWAYERGLLATTRGRQFPTHSQIQDVLNAHPGIRNSVAAIRAVTKATGIYPSVAAFLHYQFSLVDEGDCNFFWEHLRSGLDSRVGDQMQSMEEDQHPIYVLREWLIRESRRKRDISTRGYITQAQLGSILKAWKYYMLGEPVTSSYKIVYKPAQGSRPAEKWPEVYNPLAEDEAES